MIDVRVILMAMLSATFMLTCSVSDICMSYSFHSLCILS